MKIFDYKFIIILSLSLVVYFLYREIEQLTKRMNAFENKKQFIIDIQILNKQIQKFVSFNFFKA